MVIGSMLGPYRVEEKIGEGGMGEVYQATDTKLNRQVALKILPEAFAADPDRLARFRREAQVLARLNHSNIAQIHGLEEQDGTTALVLELVDGSTLADRIAQGPIPVSDAVDIGRQIAEALETAHEAGIIHRDLKPANIKVTPHGRVKVLDFGLAKAVSRETAETAPTVDVAQTRTAEDTAAGTREGVILGTAPYMSPEQARGQPLDKRTDIWAFGCVLFEMLAGRPAFRGDTIPDTVVRVLDREPDWELLPAETPSRVVELVRRCLQKETHRRCRDIGDARLELEEQQRPRLGAGASAPVEPPAVSPSTAFPAARWPVRLGLAAGVVLAMAGVLALLSGGTDAPIDSVAVLPFESASEGPDGAYLSDGITDNLINRLSSLPDLRVVPRGVAYTYQGRTADLEAVGAELGVRAVVTGRVTERDGTLIVRAELTDLADVSQLWGEQYNRSMTDLLAVEEDLVRQISNELRLQISPADVARLTRRGTENAEAYALFLKSRHHNLSVTPQGLELGLQYAREAVALDPSYGLGHAALSDAYVARTFMGLEPVEEGYARARAAAERAVELDQVNAYPRLMMGFVKHHGDWDWEGALLEFERAVQLDPGSGDAHQSYSEALVSVGRFDEAVVAAERAVDLDPLFANTVNWLAAAYLYAGRYEEALETNNTALELEPGHAVALSLRPTVLAQLGQVEEAVAHLTALLEARGQDVSEHPSLAALYASVGRREEARQIVSGLSVDDLGGTELVPLARASAMVGDMDRALQALDRAYEMRTSQLLFFNAPINSDMFRGDPRFDEFVRRMNYRE